MMKRILVTWILIAAMVLSPAAVFADQTGGPEVAAPDTDVAEQVDGQEGEGEAVTGETAVNETPAEETPVDEESVDTADDPALTEGEGAGTGEGEGTPEEPVDGSGEVGDPALLENESNGNPIVQMKVEGLSHDWITFDNANSFLSYFKMCSGVKIEIKLLANINTRTAGMLDVQNGTPVTLDLNGCLLYRDKYQTDGFEDDGEVIIVRENASLTIIDSNPKARHNGEYIGFQNMWAPKESSGKDYLLGGVICGGASKDGAGGITLKGGATVTMKGGTIAGNASEMGGGGVLLKDAGSRFILDGGEIRNNYARKANGGGILSQKGTVELISGWIYKNYASSQSLTDSGDGGGIYINNEANRALYIHGSDTSYYDDLRNYVEARSVKIYYNTAENEGGGIYCDEGTSIIRNAQIVGNYCGDNDGGGIKINDDGDSGSPTAITGCIIEDNEANEDGGGIIVSDQNNVQIANCIIINNRAGDEGGGVYFNAYGSGCNMRDCTITGNSAKRNGGGVYQYDTVALGGKMVVKDNRTDEGNNQNYFPYAYVTTPYLTIDDLSGDSELHLSRVWADGSEINDARTNGSARGLISDLDYHFEKVNDPKDNKYRKIVSRKGKAPDIATETFNVWSNVNEEQKRDSTNLGHTMKLDTSKEPVNGAPVYRGYYRFSDVMDAKEGEYHSANYYYTDGVFFNDPEKYDTHLASMTVALTLASGAATNGITTVLIPETQKNRFNYLTQTFSDIGCTNESMYVNDCYMRKPDVDTMGVAMANKTIYKDNVEARENAYLLIPIFVRSYNYGPEWVSNATLGDGSVNGGEAQGFSTSADIVIKDVDTYIDNHPEVKAAIESGRAKFWLGGYSRGGAVTNIVSKRLTDRYTGGEAGTEKGNEVFAYCMGTPNAGVENLDKEGGYLNIHNVISKTDIVTYIAPSAMGFKRYGVDHYLPGGAAGEVKATVKTYGPDNKPLTTYSDNTDYPVDFDNSDYMNFRKKLLSQMVATTPDIEYDDYFHAAEINYLWGNEYTSWIPILGKDMITEADYEPLSTKAKFCEEFWNRLLKYSANSYNAGNDWAKGDFKERDAKDYREFYATNRRDMFKYNTDYYNRTNNATVEEAMSTLIYLAMNGEKELDTSDLIDLSGLATDIALDAYDEIIGDLYTFEESFGTGYTEWINKIWEILSSEPTDEQKAKGYKSLKDVLGEEDVAKLERVFPALIATVLDLVNDDYNDTGKGQYLLGTLAYNGSGLITDHLIMCQWLRAEDDWYANDGDRYYEIVTKGDFPEMVGVWLSPTVKDGPEVEVKRGVTNIAQTNQRLYLRTQPGGAVYYTMSVNGEITVSDKLYQAVDGIELPAGSTVEVRAYSLGYDQQSLTGTYKIEVQNSEEQDAADQMLDETDAAIDEAQAADTTAQDEANKAEEAAAAKTPDETVINGADLAADTALKAAKAAQAEAEKALEAAKSAYGENSSQAQAAKERLAAAKRLVASAAAAKASTTASAAEAAKKKADAAKAAADKAAATPGKKAVDAANAAKAAADAAVVKAQAAKAAADEAVTAVDAAAMAAVTDWEKEAALKAVKKAQRVADSAASGVTSAKKAASKAAAAVKTAKAAKAKEDARQGKLSKKLPKVKIKKLKAAKKAVTVNWKKLSKKNQKKVQKVEVWVCPNKKFAAKDTKMKTVSKTKAKVKIKGLKSKKTYYVKIRTIKKVNGVKYVSKWSKVKRVKIK